MEETVVLSAWEEGDWEELAVFLSMSPDIRRVRSDAFSVRQLAEQLEMPARTGSVLSLCSVPPVEGRICDNPPLRELYPLLVSCFGAEIPCFDAWYADMSHRLRHGQCHIAAVYEEGGPAAVAMTVAECRGAAVLGAVATRPESRGRGYASACVVSLTRTLTAEHRRIYLCPKDEQARRLYIRLGFEETGEWGELSFR
ncbi:MAG: GNAT family N-acetyltransferase [Clostridiales bacterium]|nr:GNAT family N-acetyltransferase [Clostridiales bacterium]